MKTLRLSLSMPTVMDLTNEDCNDNDENSTTIAEDNDCDGTVSGYDCMTTIHYQPPCK